MLLLLRINEQLRLEGAFFNMFIFLTNVKRQNHKNRKKTFYLSGQYFTLHIMWNKNKLCRVSQPQKKLY